MKLDKTDVVNAYRSICDLFDRNPKSFGLYMLAFFWARLDASQSRPKDTQAIDLFALLAEEPDIHRASSLAAENRQTALALKEDEAATELSYWSIRSFSFEYLHDGDPYWLRCAADSFLSALEDATGQSESASLSIELENISAAIEATDSMSLGHPSEDIRRMYGWASSAFIGAVIDGVPKRK